MSSKTSNTIVFITGANTGLGLETVKSFYESPNAYTILLGGRSLDKANAAAKQVQSEFASSHSVIKTIQIDIEDDESITVAFEHISAEYGRLDVLINNAGGQFDNMSCLSLREKWTKSWTVNTASTHVVTQAFIPLLLASPSPRLLFITSGTYTLARHGKLPLPFDKSPAKGWPKEGPNITAYRASKTGLNMVMQEWVRILKNDGVKVWGISPGFLATGLGPGEELNKKLGALDPRVGADFVRSVVEGERDGEVGKVIRKADVQPW